MNRDAFDVAIVGAGPAGSACAITLARHAPGVRVCLIDRFERSGSPVGEALSPLARPALETLGLWNRFGADRHRKVYRSRAVWGTADIGGMEFMDFPLGRGWTLDRVRFNRMLADGGRAAATMALDAGVSDVSRIDKLWSLVIEGQPERIAAEVVVDATGRRGAVLRKLGHKPAKQDRMVTHAAFARDHGGEAGVTVETCDLGWWYTAGLPGQGRLVALMTDADLARQAALRDPRQFEVRLRATSHVSNTCRAPVRAVTAHPAASQIFDPTAPETIVPVGDAAAAHDPLSSYGILGAFRTGIFAAYAIADRRRGDQGSLIKYRRFLRADWLAYRKSRQLYYDRERRWPDSPFWQRRHSRCGEHI